MESKARIIIGKTDLFGKTDKEFNKGVGKSFGYGFGNTTGESICFSGSKIFTSGINYNETSRTDSKMFLMCLNSWNGSYNTLFGGQGFVTREIPSPMSFVHSLSGLLIDNNERPIVSGTMRGLVYKPFICGFTERGVLDHNFGEGGVVFGPDGGLGDDLSQTDNDIYTTPFHYLMGGHGGKIQFFSYQRSFGKTRVVSEELTGTDGLVTKFIGVDSKERVYIAGTVSKKPKFGYFLARFNKDGGIDTSFGNNGKIITSYNSITFLISQLVIFQDSIYILGGNKDNDVIAISKHDIDGNLDLSFSGDGKRVVKYQYITNVSPNSMTISEQGNIYICGTSNEKLFLTALLPSGDILKQFGEGSNPIEQGVLLYDSFENPSKGSNQKYRGNFIAIENNQNLFFVGTCFEQV